MLCWNSRRKKDQAEPHECQCDFRHSPAAAWASETDCKKALCQGDSANCCDEQAEAAGVIGGLRANNNPVHMSNHPTHVNNHPDVAGSILSSGAKTVSVSNLHPHTDGKGVLIDVHDGKIVQQNGLFYW
jgi:hypothetical protein